MLDETADSIVLKELAGNEAVIAEIIKFEITMFCLIPIFCIFGISCLPFQITWLSLRNSHNTAKYIILVRTNYMISRVVYV